MIIEYVKRICGRREGVDLMRILNYIILSVIR